jgi:hypothetical protein
MKQYRDTPYYVTSDGKCYRNSQEVKGYINSKGYVKVEVWKDNKRQYTVGLHRMVAECYIENPDQKPQINHRDGNKKNNNVVNLEWVTQEENIQHRLNVLHVGLDQSHKNTKIPAREIKILRMKRHLGIPISYQEESNKWGITRDYLSKIIVGKVRKRV